MIFQVKCFSFYILLTDQVLLSDFTSYILGNMCIAVYYFQGCDVINFEINRIFLMKPFFCKTKKTSRQKIKYLEKEKSF